MKSIGKFVCNNFCTEKAIRFTSPDYIITIELEIVLNQKVNKPVGSDKAIPRTGECRLDFIKLFKQVNTIANNFHSQILQLGLSIWIFHIAHKSLCKIEICILWTIFQWCDDHFIIVIIIENLQKLFFRKISRLILNQNSFSNRLHNRKNPVFKFKANLPDALSCEAKFVCYSLEGVPIGSLNVNLEVSIFRALIENPFSDFMKRGLKIPQNFTQFCSFLFSHKLDNGFVSDFLQIRKCEYSSLLYCSNRFRCIPKKSEYANRQSQIWLVDYLKCVIY